MVRNTCFTWLKKKGDQPAVEFDEQMHAARRSVGPTRNRCCSTRPRSARSRAAWKRLPLEFREVIILRELEELSYKEIADIARVPVGTVMSRLARARKRLQQCLAGAAPMNCETARRLMETNDPALAEHMLSCQSCIVRTHARYYEAPPGLEQKIRLRLREEKSTRSPWRWLAIAASLLLVASVAWNIALLRSRVDPQQLVADDVLSAHVRSLAGTHLLDVPSSDQHTVKPWFDGKLDFSPALRMWKDFLCSAGVWSTSTAILRRP